LTDVDFRQSYVDVGGIRTRYAAAGTPDKPPLLLLHATVGLWEAFCANLGPLSENFQCFAPDLVGCGWSDKPDRALEIKDYVQHVTSFMDGVGIPRASVIGCSLGSWVVCRLAHDEPDRVIRMILTCPSGIYGMSEADSDVRVKTPITMNPTPEGIKTRLLNHREMHDPDNLIDDLMVIRSRMLGQPNAGRALSLFDREIRQRNLLSEDEWREITTPTLVIASADEDSGNLWLRSARRIGELMPNAITVDMHEVCHWPAFERPEEFNRLAANFLISETTSVKQ
jgi:2-hydroxy-6-oxonona-2,4-dienedioate hydrolase